VALASGILILPEHCAIPESGKEVLFQFIFIPLAVRKTDVFIKVMIVKRVFK